MLAAAIIGGVGMAATAIMSKKEAGKAGKQAREYERQLATLEASRQEIINPYADVTNPYSNLQIGTRDAEFQAEQVDISLANTLDTLRATGASAGGATALAQEAARSKQGISASIEQQEIENQKLSAQGKSRQEQLMGQGKAFAFNAQEEREMQKLNRIAGLGQESRRLEAGYNQQFINTISDIGSAGMSLFSGYGAGKNG